MNRRVVIGRLLLSATVVVGLGLLLGWGRGWLHPFPSGTPSHALAPAKSPRDEDAEEAARELDKLPPRLRKIARRLADLAAEEYRQYPNHESRFVIDKRWTTFTRRQIEALDIADIAALAAALDENYALDDLIDGFREALFFVWGARDSAAARAHVMKVAEGNGYRHDEEETWKKAGEGWNCDNHIFVTRGHASIDPAAAWRIFQAELQDPALIGFGDWRDSFHDIFQTYGAKAPEEAWKILLSQNSLVALDWGLRGFIDGAPAGQNWQQLEAEWEQAFRATGREAGLSPRLRVGARWVTEDPDAALAWIGAQGKIEDLRARDGGLQLDDDFEAPPLPGLGESDRATNLKLALLGELYGSREGREQQTIELLRDLASRGQADIAARFLQREVGRSLSPLQLDLLQVLPAIGEPALREALFLQMARAVPPRGAGLASFEMSLDEPNLCLDAVKDIAGKLDLSDAVRAQAAAAFAEVEAKEAAAREKEASRP